MLPEVGGAAAARASYVPEILAADEIPESGPREANLKPECIDCKDDGRVIEEFVRKQEPWKGYLDWLVVACVCKAGRKHRT